MHQYDFVVIGAGFAGASAVAELRRNFADHSIAVIDRGTIAAGASGNARSHMIPYITASEFPGHDFYNHGFKYTESILLELERQGALNGFHHSPAVQFPSNDRPIRIIDRLLRGEKISGIELGSDDLIKDLLGFIPPGGRYAIYPDSYSVDPAILCRTWIEQAKAVVRTNESVESIYLEQHSDLYKVQTSDEVLHGKRIIIATAHETARLLPDITLTLKPIRGQLFTIDSTIFLPMIKIPLCFNGYYLPPIQDAPPLIGASYDQSYLSPLPCKIRNQKLLQNLKAVIPDETCKEIIDEEKLLLNTRVSFRAVTRDRLPLIGEIKKNLFISAGHGSRGLHSCPLGAKLICELISGQQSEVRRYERLLNPRRFN